MRKKAKEIAERVDLRRSKKWILAVPLSCGIILRRRLYTRQNPNAQGRRKG